MKTNQRVRAIPCVPQSEWKRHMRNGINHKLSRLLECYESVEKGIQGIIHQVCFDFCDRCSSKCCREEICRESVESPFLSRLIEGQKIRYDRHSGWLSPSGCRLSCGRPLVCYEFFCEEISRSEMFQAARIREIVREFVSVGNRARGGTHLICMDNLDLLSSTKMDKMTSRMKGIAAMLNKPASMPIQAMQGKDTAI